MTRVAVVTGAARGIGAATVRGLAARGWAVLAVDRCADDPALPYLLGSRSQLDQVAAGASAAAGDPAAVRALAADVRDVVAMAAAVKEAERLWGGLDAAVAVAGVIAGGVPLWEMPFEQMEAVLDTNLGGVLALARAAIRHSCAGPNRAAAGSWRWPPLLRPAGCRCWRRTARPRQAWPD